MSTSTRRSISRRPTTNLSSNSKSDINEITLKQRRRSSLRGVPIIGNDMSTYDGIIESGVVVYNPKKRVLPTQQHQAPPTPIKLPPLPIAQTQKGQAQTATKSTTKIIIAIAFYWITSLATVFLNKHVLGDDKLKNVPIFFTWFQTVFSILASFVVSTLSSCCVKDDEENVDGDKSQEEKVQPGVFQQCLMTLPAALLFTGMLLFGNLCLAYVRLPFYQVARSWTPIISILLSFICFQVLPRIGQILSCLIVVGGYVLACDSELPLDQLMAELQAFGFSLLQYVPKAIYEGEAVAYTSSVQNESIVLGIVCGLLSSLMLALYSIFNKQLQNKKIMTKNQIIMWMNFNSAVLMFVWMYNTGEFTTALDKPELYEPETFLPMLLVSLSGYLLGYATMMQIEATSALGHNISGTAKASVQTSIGWYTAALPPSPMAVVGTLLTIVGCSLYSLC